MTVLPVDAATGDVTRAMRHTAEMRTLVEAAQADLVAAQERLTTAVKAESTARAALDAALAVAAEGVGS
ncbi:hypothetical protein [Serinibacter salmoneus]|uniref:Uncharacterized protein n=1 Tax=Serinibacter salmoneus TaxID=556530 RepID=A0A2A9D0G4_9MICO|nr:hypothetical protein [Serinibacter salmoneus]PFG19881.1 hypothetical protein ATL40_1457 [Serinibacter salmoneus]